MVSCLLLSTARYCAATEPSLGPCEGIPRNGVGGQVRCDRLRWALEKLPLASADLPLPCQNVPDAFLKVGFASGGIHTHLLPVGLPTASAATKRVRPVACPSERHNISLDSSLLSSACHALQVQPFMPMWASLSSKQSWTTSMADRPEPHDSANSMKFRRPKN